MKENASFSVEKILEDLNNIIDGRLQDVTEQLSQINSTLSKTNLYLSRLEESERHISDSIDEMEEKLSDSFGRTNFLLDHIAKSVGALCSVAEKIAEEEE